MASKEFSSPISPHFKSLYSNRPVVPIEALMNTAPFQDAEESLIELQPLREAVAVCIEELNEEDRWIINGIMSESLSLQQIAKQLGVTKTHVWRLRNRAFERLQNIMERHPEIRRRVRVADTLDQSAQQWTTWYGNYVDYSRYANVQHLRNMRDRAIKDYNAGRPIKDSIWHAICSEAIAELREINEWDSAWMGRLLARKQHDYGHGNINAFGEFGVLVRLSDKIERYSNLRTLQKQGRNESIKDTLDDIVGYCVIIQMLRDKTFDLELGEDYTK